MVLEMEMRQVCSPQFFSVSCLSRLSPLAASNRLIILTLISANLIPPRYQLQHSPGTINIFFV